LPSAIDKIILPTYTLFDNGKSVIKPAGRKTLDELANKLKGDFRVVLPVGFTSTPGSNAYNMALSIRRADAVKAYLVSRDIDARRIHGSGQGENHPIAANTTSAGRAENRRVEIEVLATSQKYRMSEPGRALPSSCGILAIHTYENQPVGRQAGRCIDARGCAETRHGLLHRRARFIRTGATSYVRHFGTPWLRV
jgi:hypothetical protein